MPAKILVADDDVMHRELLVDILTRLGYLVVTAENGSQALSRTMEHHPDLAVLDVEMPQKNGYEVCRELRAHVRTRNTPILFLTGRAATEDKVSGLMSGGDDYLTKPFEPDELKARLEGLLRRSKQALSANPLTRLPGGPIIEEEAVRRLEQRLPLAFAYIDIDNFKAYNDVYGYQRGDVIIKDLANVLIETTESLGTSDDFLGHIGGDDFVLITAPARASFLTGHVAQEFDRLVPGYYSKEDYERGFIETLDRKGSPRQFPVMTLSIAVVSNQKGPIEHYGRLVEQAAELKSYAKQMVNRRGSIVVEERRTAGGSP
ncbi:MAG: response regulator [Elusimicrobia bacterium]|nr:response regulator [Elusimicrobiota bacterium]